MAYQQIAEGGVLSLVNLGDYEGSFEEGSKGKLELVLRTPVSSDIISELNSIFSSQGIPAYAEAGSPILNIYFEKGFPWLAVIVAAVLGLIALAILIVSWRLFKEVPGAIIPVSLLALAVIAGATVLGIYLVRRKT